MQRPILRLFSLREPVPALFLVHEILKAVLDPLPQIENSLGAFLTVDRLAVLLAEQPALLAIKRVSGLCEKIAAAEPALNAEYLTAFEKARILSKELRDISTVKQNNT